MEILQSDVNQYEAFHQHLDYVPEVSLAPVYARLIAFDDHGMERSYSAFDSVRRAAHLDEASFANMVVSCVQSVPYFLVLDGACDGRQYLNPFISRFLDQCENDCCIGYSKYGVRPPAQFIGDLKGDCDTRTLLIYTILKKFNYNVALLTSLYYQHAVVAVHFHESNSTGIAMTIRNRSYLFWETTPAGFRAGDIPPAYQDLSRWTIDLLHEKD